MENRKISNPDRIAVLINSRFERENLSKQDRLKISQIIEEKMTHFVFLPYQICNCSYIGENKAWASYNLNNKRTLSLAINEINYHLETLSELEENDVISKIIPLDYHIPFSSICFDFAYPLHDGDLPRSYLIYAPETKTGKRSQYPIIAFFNTIKNGEHDNNGENYIGELFYAINGDLSKATIHCRKRGKFSEFNFSVVGRTFSITSIKTIGENEKLFTLYDCMWKYTDYIDFAD